MSVGRIVALLIRAGKCMPRMMRRIIFHFLSLMGPESGPSHSGNGHTQQQRPQETIRICLHLVESRLSPKHVQIPDQPLYTTLINTKMPLSPTMVYSPIYEFLNIFCP